MLSTTLSTLLALGCAGSAESEPAPTWTAPVDHVTVFSDRARVRRRARGSLAAGVHEIRLPPLTGVVWMDTVRASAKGAQVIRVERRPVERLREELPKLKELLKEAETTLFAQQKLEVQQQVLSQRKNWLDALRVAPVVPEAQRDGRAPPSVRASTWLATIDTLGQIRAEIDLRLARKQSELRALREHRAAVLARLQDQDPYNIIVPGVEVVVRLRATKAGPVHIDLEYFVPGAFWKPVYDLDFNPKTQKLTVKTGAWVQQNTLEDWGDVALELSTSMPGRLIDLPPPLTWTLGESRDFKFKARRRGRVPTAPASAAIVTAPYPRPIDLAVWNERLGQVMAANVGNKGKRRPRRKSGSYKKRTNIDFSDSEISGELVKPQGQTLLNRLSEDAPSRPPMAPAPVMLGDMAESEETVSLQSTSGRSSGSRSGRSFGSRKRMAIFGQGAPARPHFRDRLLPAVSAAGFDFSYKAPGRFSLSSGGEGRRVPLDTKNFKAKVQHEATPSIEAIAYLEARVTNERSTPLLAGTTNIFVDGEFVSQGSLKTTGPGGTVEFALGADEDIRLERRVLQTTKTTGIISKDDETEYRHIIEVGNYKKRAVAVEIIDQFPKSKNDEVKIDNIKFSPSPAEKGKDDGIVRWRVDLKPGEVKKLELRYRITRPEGWQMYQR